MMTVSLTNKLKHDWMKIAQSVVRKRGKRLSDLRFAKRTDNGYAFFMDTNIHWDALHEITQELAKLYPHYEYAALAEACSEFANTENEIHLS